MTALAWSPALLVAQPCLVSYSVTANPAPLNGTYSAGQTVTFCLTVNAWNTTNANWFHGVVPIPGPGWDLSTMQPGPPPATCGTSGGTWGWYASCTGTAITAIGTVGPGFFFDLDNNGNPGNNFGDYCLGASYWQFCWTITVDNGVDCVNGADLGMGVNTYGDSETGSWGSSGCTGDPVPASPAAVALCCSAEAGNDAVIAFCETGAPVDLFPLLGPSAQPGGSWTGPLGGFNGTLDPATAPPGAYSYDVLGPNGNCSDQATVTVTIGQQPQAGTGAQFSACSSDVPFDLLPLLVNADGGGTWSGPGALQGGFFDPAGGTPGTYTYTLTAAAPCTTASSEVDVLVSASVYAGVDGYIAVCDTFPVFDMFLQLAGQPDPNGTWTDPNGNPHSASFDPATDVGGMYTYTVDAVAPCAADSSTLTVVVDPQPDAGTGVTINVCSSDAAFTLFNLLGGVPQTGGTWTDPNGNLTNDIFTPGTSPDGDYTYTVGIGPPCGTDESIVTVTTSPAVDAGTDAAVNLCAAGGTTDLFPLLGPAAQGGGTWTGPGNQAFSGTYDPAFDGSGAYTYTVTATGACSAADAVVTVTEVNQPDAGLDATVDLCTDALATDLFSQLGGTPDAGGSWTDPLNQVCTGVIDPGTATSGTYTYTVSAPAPCVTATAVVDVVLVAPPPTGQTAALTACTTGSPVDLFTLLQGVPAGGTWSDPLGSASTGVVDPATAAAGPYTYTLQAQQPCADGIHTVDLALIPPPNAGIDGSLTVCANGAAVQLSSALGGNPVPGGGWYDAQGVAHGSTYDPVVDVPGTYQYIVAGVAPCLSDTSEVTVTESAPADAGLNASYQACENGSPFDPLLLLGGSPDVGGSWTAPNNTPVTPPLDPATAASGVYTYTVNGQAPCPAVQAELTVNVDGLPNAGTDGALQLCDYQAVTDLATVLGPGAQGGGQWTGPNGSSTTALLDPSSAATGVYSYTVQGQGACAGNSDEAVVQVSISYAPTLLADAVPASGCAPLEVLFVAQTSVPVASMTWNLGDGAVIQQNGPLQHTYQQAGLFSPTVQVIDASGCTWVLPSGVTVRALPPPVVIAQVERPVVPLDDAVVRAWTLGGGHASQLWSVNGTAVDTSAELLFRIDPAVAGNYLICVMVTDTAGCTAESCVTVLVDDVLVVHVPNAFTPNGDGVNDSFLPVLVGADTDSYSLRIFNRWGEEVFLTEELDVAWTGAMFGTGNIAPDGIYTWRLFARDAYSSDRREFFGHVLLMR